MWIREKLEADKRGRLLARGRVTSTGEGFSVSGEENLRQPEVIAPYGLCFQLPEAQPVISAEGKILGVPMAGQGELKAGEVLLKNVFGAEIKLCEDGAVVINGQRFERSEG